MRQQKLPSILLGDDEHTRLVALANAVMEKNPDVADELLSELERATVVVGKKPPPNVVRMGSTVSYRADDQERQVTLVYPGDADIEAGRISILTPIGAALIGLKAGQSIDWKARDGRTHRLTILQVVQQPD
ncbi:MAG: nucleoside diphosphate kinase regulator [Rhizobiales bacterium 65-9]|nr:nucleoside diphosphate kinase regulator [Hyphomicrobiales bacterium]OJY38609.1 MAG: nucleoside diphosphate kinase regulator [Rhizobiales bacterium 65-9]